MMWLGWETLRDDWVQTLDPHSFELFCRDLVLAESSERWSLNGTHVEGPAPRSQNDGGVDLRIEFRAAPQVSSEAWCARTRAVRTLLGDGPVGTTLLVSCKAGSNWLKGARGDASNLSERVLPVLQAGGRLLVVTSQFCPAPPTEGKKAKGERSKGGAKKSANAAAPEAPRADGAMAEKTGVRRDLAERYAARLSINPAMLFERIDVIDGRDLSAYLRAMRSPALGERWGMTAGVRAYSTLMSFAQWQKPLDNRPVPLWGEDPARATSLEQMDDLFGLGVRAPEDAVICVVGPPGIGKTRFVQHALERSSRGSHAVVSNDPDFVSRELDAGLLQRAPGALFVVDDCTSANVRTLREKFIVAATEHGSDGVAARMVLIYPSGLSPDLGALGCPVVQLEPLSEQASCEIIRAVVQRELDDDKVRHIHRLTQGYPWFAILVARESPISTRRDAICRALVPGGALPEAKQHARALLAVMLARGEDWTDIRDDECERLALAVNLADRLELERLIAACEARGIVRKARRRYVTPYLLEREVWSLLTDGEPDRPITRRIVERCPERIAKLVERLREAGIDSSHLSSVARTVSDALLLGPASLAEVETSPLLTALRLCAEIDPAQTLEHLAHRVEHTSLDALRLQRRVRRPFIAALRQIARAKVPFATLEAVLFRLTLAENEAYVDRATSVWGWLFLPWIWPDGPSHEARMSVAEQRCLLGPEAERVAAVRGLALTPSQWTWQRGTSEPDEARRPDPDAMRSGYQALWRLLLRCACAGVGEALVLAQAAVVEHLRMAITAGLLEGLEAPLRDALRALPEALRLKVRRASEAEHHVAMRVSGARDALWAVVDHETRGSTYGERLRERVQAPWALTDDDRLAETRDFTSLIEEGLRLPELPLRAHLADLEADNSSPRFTILAGALDTSCLLLDTLVERARAPGRTTLLAFYCVGHSDANRRELVGRWVDAWSSDPHLARAVFEIIVRVGPHDAWIALVERLLAHDEARDLPLKMLSWGRWEDVSEEARGRFLLFLASLDRPYARAVVLDRLAEGGRELTAREAGALERALVEIASHDELGHSAWEFVRAAERLLATGRVDAVAKAALRAVVSDGGMSAELIVLVVECAKLAPDTLWDSLVLILESSPTARAVLVDTLGAYNVLGQLPAERVMAWIGDDVRRADEVAQMLSFARDEVPALAVALTARFGERSPVAQRLTDQILEPPGDVRDFTAFYEHRREVVGRWVAAARGATRAWMSDTYDRLDREVRSRRGSEPTPHRRTG